jgi:formylglycine-generating enzyme required for sulfatase activity
MTPLSPPAEDTKITIARESIERFAQKFGLAHLYFAYHAAFPLAITPHLAYQIWANFHHDINGKPLNIPWVAVADLLLSPLCDAVETELYEMDLAVRTVLLNELKLDPNFGKNRLEELSDFLLTWVKQRLRKNPSLSDVTELYEWIAFAYSKNPHRAAEKIIATLQVQDWQNPFELVRLSSIIATFDQPFAESQEIKPLLTFGKIMGKYGRGDKAVAVADFAKLGKGKQEIKIAGIRLQIPQFFTFETVTVNPQGKIIHRETKQAQYLTENIGETTLEMVYIPGGTFTMGSPEGEGYSSAKPQHPVTIKPFLMGKYPVTQAQWEAVANLPKIQNDLDPNPSDFKGKNRPVENVSWNDTIEFCARLSKKTGKNYRLPSEAEWEYACRAGTTTPFHFGETITPDLANYDGNHPYGEGPKGIYRQETTPVGSFQVANAFGLYDMHGNVWEWCADPWHDNYEGAPTDGRVWDENNNDNHYRNYIDLLVNIKNDNGTRLLRGGAWCNVSNVCASGLRYYYIARYVSNDNGFRVVCV